MMIQVAMKRRSAEYLVLCAGMLFIYVQLLTVMIEATYTFGLLGVSIPPEIGFAGFLLTPLLLLVFPKILSGRRGRVFTLITACIAVLCWGALLLLDTRGRMLAGAIGTGAGLLFIPAFFNQRPSTRPGFSLGAGLAFAILGAVLLAQENFGTPFLPTAVPNLFPIALVFVLAIEWFAWYKNPLEDSPEPPRARSFLHTSLLFLGLGSILLLVYFSFSSPTVIARWTGAGYLQVVGLSVAAAAVFLFWLFARDRQPRTIPRSLILVWNILFLITLVGAILPYQIAFPLNPASTDYPLAEPAAGLLADIALVLLLLLHPILYLDAILIGDHLADGSVSAAHLAGAAAIFAIYQLVMIFGHIFTTVYDYIPGVGPLFRDHFWLVYALPGLILFFAVSATQRSYTRPAQPAEKRWPLIAAISLPVLILLTLLYAQLQLPAGQPRNGSLRVMTYNLQQGYSQAGQKNYEGQLAVIREHQPDILGLQESDTARIAGGNSDLVRYLAVNLKMYSYYGPKTVTGTFGIALLSIYPIENPRTFYMYSQGEQTAVIEAQVHIQGILYTIFVTHLGNDGPLIQQQQVLQLTQGKPNVIMMGDFNFRPASEQYRQTTQLYKDSALIAPSQNINPPGQNLSDRIDHIFLSPGISITSYEYFGEGPSDHPSVIIDLH
jgi:endonuclease/exonuclease/phosphatase family metal-dependent hydrolase